jgi:succinate dehydrogenase / fumarate reductase iron-sulfur subunit
MKLKIYRYNNSSKESSFDTFEFEPKAGMTVLNALFYVQDHFDDSLSFRYSCRGAVCGTCAVLINKVPRLACRTQISALLTGADDIELKPYPAIKDKTGWDRLNEILVEPLPHLPMEKDLIVNMDKFFQYYRAVEPVLKADESVPEKEWRMDQSAEIELEKYTNCILCAACFGACPVDAKNEKYLGPAALAKLYRFYLDPREMDSGSRLVLADHPDGWWACEFHKNCKKVCPKGVPPNLAIGKARSMLKK